MRQLRSWARSLCPCCATTGIWSDSAEAVLVPQLQFIEGRCFPSCRRGKSTWSCLFTKPQRLCSCSMFPGGRYPVVQVVCLPVVAHDRGSNGHTAPILRCRTVVAYRQRHVIYIASGPPPPQPNHNHHNHHNHHKPPQTGTNHHKPPQPPQCTNTQGRSQQWSGLSRLQRSPRMVNATCAARVLPDAAGSDGCAACCGMSGRPWQWLSLNSTQSTFGSRGSHFSGEPQFPCH